MKNATFNTIFSEISKLVTFFFRATGAMISNLTQKMGADEYQD
jgi:hypothetical protein